MTVSEREKAVLAAAKTLHEKWMALVNFSHRGLASSQMQEALVGLKAQREVRDAYDEAFARLTSECELLRQGR